MNWHTNEDRPQDNETYLVLSNDEIHRMTYNEESDLFTSREESRSREYVDGWCLESSAIHEFRCFRGEKELEKAST